MIAKKESKTYRWDCKFMDLAKHIAEWSKDTSSKIGAVVVDDDRNVLVTGYNGPPRGVRDDVPERQERPYKYHFPSHAEENAVAQAARTGVALNGCTMYVSGLPPCSTCARLIIQAGIRRLVVESLDVPDRWKESCGAGMEMLHEAGIDMWIHGELKGEEDGE
jgi:dCMP deaminase